MVKARATVNPFVVTEAHGQRDRQKAPEASLDTRQSAAAPLAALRVLLVEDRDDDAQLVVQELEKSRRRLAWRRVGTRAEMLRALVEESWDIVIVDDVLPGLSALEANEILREMGLDVPLVAVSGKLAEDAAVEIVRAGARDFVSKDRLARLLPIVERELSEASLRREATRRDRALQVRTAALEASSTGIYLADADGRIERANQALTELSGYGLDELRGRRWDFFQDGLLAGETAEAVSAAIRAGSSWRGELPLRRRDGSVGTVRATINSLIGGDEQRHLLVTLEDMTASREAEARIALLAQHDELTGLANRRLFLERLEYALSVARRRGRHVAVVFVDLDRFKEINDEHGHQAGDEVLKLLTRRLSAIVRETDSVARFGGDEIVLAFVDLAQPEEASRLAQKTLEAFAAPLRFEGCDIEVSASAGIAVYPRDGSSASELIQAADVALRRVKLQGGGTHRFFAAAMNAEEARRIALEQGLRKALGTNGLWLEYQPQIDARCGDAVGVEALARWGSALPDEFVPVAEASGLIVKLDEWVLAEACRQAAAWKKSGAWIPRVSVNISAANLRDEGIVTRVEQLLRDLDLPGERLELEFTERMAVRDLAVAARVMTDLRRLRVRMTIDDFGTGWSSLSYLSKLPLNRLKIDRSFVQRIGASARDEAIIRATIAVAHSLGLDVVGEGVETPEQRAFLEAAGCDSLQGYLFSRALPARELEEFEIRQARSGDDAPASGSWSLNGRRSELPSVLQEIASSSEDRAVSASVAFVSTYPPTRCGLATFTAALIGALGDSGSPGSIGIVSCVEELSAGATAPEVVAEWVRGSRSSLEAAARVLNSFDSVIVQHEFGLHGGSDGSDILDLVARVSVPVIAVLHTVSSTPTPSQRAIVEQLAAAARVVVQTDIARRRLIQSYDVDPANVTVIPHGASLNIEPPPPPNARRRPVVLTWGLLGPSKGIELALEAFVHLRDLDPLPRYVVLGQTHPKVLRAEGESYREFLEARAKELGVDDLVVFENGYLDVDSVLAEVRAADIVLLPYRSLEQVVSGVLVEAIAAGKPVVATAFPHALELLGEGSGIVVPHDDPDAIAQALRVFLTDAELASAAAAVARQQARSLSWESVGRRYRRLANAASRASTAVAL